MEKYFEDLAVIRGHFIDFLNQYDLQRLVFIPMGFKNHIFWNIAHALVTQQLMTNYLSDRPMLVDNEWVSRFKKGTFGSPDVDQSEVEQLIELLQISQERLRKDYFSENLNQFKGLDTSFGINLIEIEDAIRYNNLHESLHLGYIMALSKSIPTH